MYYHSSVVEALRGGSCNFDELLTRTRAILKKYDVNFARQQLTDTVKPLFNNGIISKTRNGREMIHALRDDDHARKSINVIMDISDGGRTVDENDWVLDRYERAIQNVENEKNKDEIYHEITSNLVELSLLTLAMTARMLTLQNDARELPFFVKELKQHEIKTRKTFVRISVVMQKLGGPYYEIHKNELNRSTGRRVMKRYQKLTKDSLFFRESH